MTAPLALRLELDRLRCDEPGCEELHAIDLLEISATMKPMSADYGEMSIRIASFECCARLFRRHGRMQWVEIWAVGGYRSGRVAYFLSAGSTSVNPAAPKLAPRYWSAAAI